VADLPGKEIWRGGVTPWQCDEMGHMNVQFYLAIASEGLAGLAAMLGMPHAFTSGASSTLLVREHHVRFLKEARPGAALVMTGGLLDIGETEASLLQLLSHATGEPAAAITAKVVHVTPRDLRPFPWTRATRDRVDAMRIAAPDFARPRSISVEPVETMASLRQAEALGLPMVAGGAVMTADCDVFGRMLPEHLLYRIYASVGHMIRPSHQALLEAQPEFQGRLGGAAVEYRAVYHAWPRAGDRLELRSAHRELTAKARRVVHWLLDPSTGRPWASGEVVSLFLDLQERKSLTLSGDALEAMAIDPMDELGL
jgi:acyl-CoA thioester hydrolase